MIKLIDCLDLKSIVDINNVINHTKDFEVKIKM
jgi:hypothetical protein